MIAPVEVARIEIRGWALAARVLLPALAREPFVDMSFLAADVAMPVDRQIWVAWCDQRPVGLIVLDSDDLGVEVTIAVPAAERRLGVASALLGFVRARSVRPIHALVDCRNEAACAFFRAHSFSCEDTELEGLVRFRA